MISNKELRQELEKYPDDIRVIYSKFSEYCLLEAKEIEVQEHCKPRPDGWVQNKRPDMETETYLVFPGN